MKLRFLTVGAAAGVSIIVGLALTLSVRSADGAPQGYGPPHGSSAPNKPSTPLARGSATPAGSVDPRALAADMPDKRFDLPPLAKENIPSVRSELPSADEWKNAPLIEVTRRSVGSRFCRVYRVREYLKVHCGMPTAGIRQLAGSTADVQIFVSPIKPDGFLTEVNGGQAILPLRKNESRLIQFYRAETDGWQAEPEPWTIVDVSWPDGTESPTVILR